MIPALAVGKIHQTTLYNIACGKDWKKSKLGDDMFHKLSKKSQEFREDTFFLKKLTLTFGLLDFLRKNNNNKIRVNNLTH